MSDPQPHGRHGLFRRVRGGAERGLRPEEALDADTLVLREFQKSIYLFPKKNTKVIFTFYFQSVGSPATAGRWSRPSTTWSTSTSWWGSRRSWRHSFRCWRSRYQSEHDSQKNKINCFKFKSPPRFFRGASRMFAESEQFRHIRRTKHKDTPSDKTVQVCGK